MVADRLDAEGGAEAGFDVFVCLSIPSEQFMVDCETRLVEIYLTMDRLTDVAIALDYVESWSYICRHRICNDGGTVIRLRRRY